MPLIQANHYFETVTDQAGPSHKIAYDFGLLEKKVDWTDLFFYMITIFIHIFEFQTDVLQVSVFGQT